MQTLIVHVPDDCNVMELLTLANVFPIRVTAIPQGLLKKLRIEADRKNEILTHEQIWGKP